jgi:hypothetical protein
MPAKQALRRGHTFTPEGIDGIVPEVSVLDEMMDRVDAESIDAAGQPESQDREHCGDDFRVAPIQIGLFTQERVIVELR